MNGDTAGAIPRSSDQLDAFPGAQRAAGAEGEAEGGGAEGGGVFLNLRIPIFVDNNSIGKL